jgi:prepilin peptidase CpaA
MNNQILTYALTGALAIALLFCVYSDIRYRKIYNKVTLPIALAAPLYWFATGTWGLQDVGIHIAVGAGVFLFFAVTSSFGFMGGGDVKLFSVLALWFHWTQIGSFLIYASLLGAAVTVVFAVTHKMRKQKGKIQIPYGVAIAVSGLIIAGEPLFNHFG